MKLIGKEEVKLSLFADEVILLIDLYIRYIYIKPERLHQKLSEPINSVKSQDTKSTYNNQLHLEFDITKMIK